MGAAAPSGLGGAGRAGGSGLFSIGSLVARVTTQRLLEVLCWQSRTEKQAISNGSHLFGLRFKKARACSGGHSPAGSMAGRQHLHTRGSTHCGLARQRFGTWRIQTVKKSCGYLCGTGAASAWRSAASALPGLVNLRPRQGRERNTADAGKPTKQCEVPPTLPLHLPSVADTTKASFPPFQQLHLTTKDPTQKPGEFYAYVFRCKCSFL